MISISYNIYKRKKKNGKYRIIYAPNEELKQKQKNISSLISERIKFPSFVTGFINGKSIRDNALCHLSKDWVINLDIDNFFPTIDKENVKAFLINNKLYSGEEDYYSELLTYENKLVQGSPASPVIANAIALEQIDPYVIEILDNELGKNNYTYTRYVDDITISSSSKDKDRPFFKELINKIINNLENNSPFKISKRKIALRGKGQRQFVTGIVVNEKMSIRKEERNRLRAVMHKIKKGELELTPQIFGQINYVRDVNSSLYQKLTKGFNNDTKSN